jgi:hypothetical protein
MCLISKQKRSLKKDRSDVASSGGESNSQTTPRRAPVHFCLAVAALFAMWLGAAIADAGPLDLPPSDFDIIDATEGMQVIGHGHYEVTPDGPWHATVFGEDRFNDGEYDIYYGQDVP